MLDQRDFKMPHSRRKKRACAKCGRPAKGHPGPMGMLHCTNTPFDFTEANDECGGGLGTDSIDSNIGDVGRGAEKDAPGRTRAVPVAPTVAGLPAGPPARSPRPIARRSPAASHNSDWVEPPRWRVVDQWTPGAAELHGAEDGRGSHPADIPPAFSNHGSPGFYRREHSCPPVPVVSNMPDISCSRAQSASRAPPGNIRDDSFGAIPRARPSGAMLGADVFGYPPSSLHGTLANMVPSRQYHDGLAADRPPFLRRPPPGSGSNAVTHDHPQRLIFDEYPRHRLLPSDFDFGAIPTPSRGTEHVDEKTKGAALRGEYLDLADVLNVNAINDSEFKTFVEADGTLSVKCTRSKRAISSSFKWLEAWTIYEKILCNVYGLGLFEEMAAYRLFILSLFNKFKIPYVFAYDIRHRQALGARRSFHFSQLSNEIYVTTFDSNALRAVTRCTICNSTDHGNSDCPFRAPGQGGLPRARGQGERSGAGAKAPGGDKSSEICYLYQEGKCRAAKCSRKHCCMACHGPEGYRNCSKCSGGGAKGKSKPS